MDIEKKKEIVIQKTQQELYEECGMQKRQTQRRQMPATSESFSYT